MPTSEPRSRRARLLGSILILAAALAPTLAGSCGPKPAPEGTNQAVGRVDAEVNGLRIPLPGVLVTVRTLDGQTTRPERATTDAAGWYRTPTVRKRNVFLLCAEAPGFVSQCHSETLPFDRPSEAAEARDFVLRPAGDAVRGSVLLSDGSPCADPVGVSLLDDGGALVASVEANVQGEYVIAELGDDSSPRVTFEARCSSLRAGGLHSLTPEERSGAVPIDWSLPNAAPEVHFLQVVDGEATPLRFVPPGASVDLAADATDPDGDPLEFAWSNDGGDLVSQDTPILPWTAPSFSRTDRIHLEGSDGRGGVVKASLPVRVQNGTDPFSGTVRDESGAPIKGALVEVDGSRTLTGPEGGFLLSVPAAEVHVLRVTHPGHAPWIERVHESAAALDLRLPVLDVQTIAPTLDQQLWNGSRGLSVRIAANTLVDARGAAPPGLVHVGLHTGAPGSRKPLGSRVATQRGVDETWVPEQVGSVEIWDDAGRLYNLAPGSEAVIGFQAPELVAASQPRTLALARLDEASGLWEPRGEARRVGSRFEATVTTFSSWSTGTLAPGNTACLHVHANTGALELPARLRVYTSPIVPLSWSFVDEFVVQDTENAIYRLPPGELARLEVRPFSDPENVLNTLLVPTGSALSPAEPPFPYEGCADVTIQAATPPDGSGNSQKYLWRLQNGEADALAYYQSIGALPAKDTFAKWMAANGFSLADFADDVVFFNPNELGLTRRANCKQMPNGSESPSYACYVTKFGHIGEVPGLSLQQGAQNVAAGDTVAMEYSVTPSSNGERVVQFFIYRPGPSPEQMPLALDTKFDDDPGKKYVPGVCMHCHGLFEPQFVVFDVHEYEYPPTGPYAREAQQERFREMNAIVSIVSQASNPNLPSADNPALELLEDMYGSSGEVFVPGDEASPALEGDPVWDEVVKPYCRTCHMWHPGLWDFDFASWGSAGPHSIGTSTPGDRICQGMMPHAIAPQLELWASSDPFLPALLDLSCVTSTEPPAVQITTPSDGSEVGFGGLTLETYTAVATDLEDGSECCAIEWSSDEGVMGYGASLQHAFASPGPHEVCATASDSNGKEATDCIAVTSTNASPTVTIQTPLHQQQVFTGTPVALWGTSFDPNEPYQALECASFSWSFFGTGAPSPVAGACQATATFSTPGDVVVYLQASDPDGAPASDTVTVEVVDPPPGTPASVTILEPDAGAGFPPQSWVTFDATVTSHGGGPVTLQWSLDEGSGKIPLAGVQSGAFVPQAFLTPECGSESVDVLLEATDSFGTGAPDVRTIEVLWPAC